MDNAKISYQEKVKSLRGIHEYSYKDLFTAVEKDRRNKEALYRLAYWLEQYDNYNGEFYSVTDPTTNRRVYDLYPVWEEVEEGEFDIVDWEIRW